jgi:hypothetical protein
MAYNKHEVRIVELTDLDDYLTSIESEIPWLYHNKNVPSYTEVHFGFNDGSSEPTTSCGISNPNHELHMYSYYNNFNSTLELKNNFNLETDFSREWINGIYTTDNLIAFTLDSAREHDSKNTIAFIISKLENDICMIPNLAALNYLSDIRYSSGAMAIKHDTIMLRSIPTKDDGYELTNRLGRKTILAPLPLNNLNREIATDVYAVVCKEHPSICDVLSIDDHHFLTDGRIACRLD